MRIYIQALLTKTAFKLLTTIDFLYPVTIFSSFSSIWMNHWKSHQKSIFFSYFHQFHKQFYDARQIKFLVFLQRTKAFKCILCVLHPFELLFLRHFLDCMHWTLPELEWVPNPSVSSFNDASPKSTKMNISPWNAFSDVFNLHEIKSCQRCLQTLLGKNVKHFRPSQLVKNSTGNDSVFFNFNHREYCESSLWAVKIKFLV